LQQVAETSHAITTIFVPLDARLGEPVGVGHLRGDEVHPPHDDRLRVLDGVEVELDRSAGRSPSGGRRESVCQE